MYMMALNVRNTGLGNIQSVAMDGTGSTSFSGLTTSHHDLAAIPGGFATLLWNNDGEGRPLLAGRARGRHGHAHHRGRRHGNRLQLEDFHTNSVHYYPGDDSYTVGDRNPSLYVKLTREGQLVWQFGGTNPKDPSKFFTGVPTWAVTTATNCSPTARSSSSTTARTRPGATRSTLRP